jgi:hypothetical protein
MRELFSGGSKSDDLLQWAEKLEGLGAAVESLFMHDDGLGDIFGPQIGGVIMDYARAIKETLKPLYPCLQIILEDRHGNILEEIEQLRRATASH